MPPNLTFFSSGEICTSDPTILAGRRMHDLAPVPPVTYPGSAGRRQGCTGTSMLRGLNKLYAVVNDRRKGRCTQRKHESRDGQCLHQ